jgi:hypothetical protein
MRVGRDGPRRRNLFGEDAFHRAELLKEPALRIVRVVDEDRLLARAFVGEHVGELQIETFDESPYRRVIAVDQFAAVFAHLAVAPECALGMHAAADALLRFEDGRGDAAIAQHAGRREAGYPRADDGDFRSVRRFRDQRCREERACRKGRKRGSGARQKTTPRQPSSKRDARHSYSRMSALRNASNGIFWPTKPVCELLYQLPYGYKS